MVEISQKFDAPTVKILLSSEVVGEHIKENTIS